MKVELKPKFNKKALQGISKENFIELHKEAYPDLDLSAKYDELGLSEKKEETAPKRRP